MVDKRFLHGSLLLFMGVIIGLSVSSFSCGPLPVEGLIFVGGTTNIGASGINDSINIYNYNLTFYNGGEDVVYINTIEPVLDSDPHIISSQESQIKSFNSYVPSGSTISIEGSIKLYSSNSSKVEIMEIEPIQCINMTSTEIIHCFSYPPVDL